MFNLNVLSSSIILIFNDWQPPKFIKNTCTSFISVYSSLATTAQPLYFNLNSIYHLTQSEIVSHSVVSDSLWCYGLSPTRLLHPWDFPGKNTGVGCHFLFQEIFPTQGLNLGLPHCRQTLYHLSQRIIYKLRSKHVFQGYFVTVQSLNHI